MKVIKHLDVVEIDASDVEEAVRRLVLEQTGRSLHRITWTNIVDQTCIGEMPFKLVYLNATLNPES